MPDPLQALLASGAVPSTSFPTTSRYAGIGLNLWDPHDGSPPVPYLRRRFCPQPSRFALLAETRIVEGSRRDLLAARQLGDAAVWWQLADANGVVDPRDLAEPAGRTLRITLPEGVPGPSSG
jgi:hypothetical protein